MPAPSAFSDKETHLALRGVLVTAVGLPATRVWENVAPNPNPPPAGTPYVNDAYAPATRTLLSTTRPNGGILRADGLYLVQYFGLAGSGLAMRDGIAAILAVFPPGKAIALASGFVLRIAGFPLAPSANGITPLTNGFAFSTITIPWWVLP